MKKKEEKTYYKVSFVTGNEMYQVCAKRVVPSDLFGMVEISDFIFPENQVVIDPGEEQIKREFGNMKRTVVPHQAIIRIDELPLDGEMINKLVKLGETKQSRDSSSNIIQLPR